MLIARVNAHPGRARIAGSIDAAADFAGLISVAYEHFIRIAGVDQNAGEVAEREVASATRPVIAAVVRHEKRLLGADIDIRRPLRILNDDIDRSGVRNAAHLLPRLAAIPRDKNT